METNYNVGAPAMGNPPATPVEQPLLSICAPPASDLVPGGGTITTQSLSYLDLFGLVNCQFSNTPGSALQFNLIFAPDLPPPAELTQPPLCVPPSTSDAFHAFAPSLPNIQSYLTNPPFESGFQQCMLAALSPIGLFGNVQGCLAQGVTEQAEAAAAAGAVVCPIFGFLVPDYLGAHPLFSVLHKQSVQLYDSKQEMQAALVPEAEPESLPLPF